LDPKLHHAGWLDAARLGPPAVSDAVRVPNIFTLPDPAR
jgi:hypothetical protein